MLRVWWTGYETLTISFLLERSFNGVFNVNPRAVQSVFQVPSRNSNFIGVLRTIQLGAICRSSQMMNASKSLFIMAKGHLWSSIKVVQYHVDAKVSRAQAVRRCVRMLSKHCKQLVHIWIEISCRLRQQLTSYTVIHIVVLSAVSATSLSAYQHVDLAGERACGRLRT